ncbi:MAG: radical SAM protein [Actinobacteria bacterium]|nr:MAG: radical SAM protein [Actinomycetota bacterium]
MTLATKRSLSERIKYYSFEQTVDKIFRMATWVSDDTIIRGVTMLEKMAVGPKRNTLGLIKGAFKDGHPSLKLLRKVMKEVHPNCKKNFIRNFVVKLILSDVSLKKDYRDKYGYTPPSTILISPTMRCNLKCQGCYVQNYQKEEGMDPDLIDSVINQSKEIGINLITILGGEPLIYPQLFDIFALHKDMVFQVFTNGTLITSEVARRFCKLGNVTPVISIEGFEKQTDDRRGKGVFEKTMKAMDNLRNEGVMFFYYVTSTRKNARIIASDSFVDLMIKKGAVVGWIFNHMPVSGDMDLSLMPTPQQRDYVRKRTSELRFKKPILLIDFFGDGSIVNGCLAGGKIYLHINSKGDVEPCIFCHFATDNIKQKSLVEVLNSPFFKGIRKMQPYCDNDLRPCMLIDHPHIFRTLVSKYKPSPTSEGAELLVDKLGPKLDKYGKDLAKIYEPVWKKDYGWVKEWRENCLKEE